MFRLLAFFVALLTVAGCKVDTGLNVRCVMVKRDPNDATGKAAVPLTYGEIKGAANKDYISFGAVECLDFTCVRDSTFSSDGGAVPADNEPALGYCSRPCVAGSTIGCPSGAEAEALDNSYKTRMSCRALLLDDATLLALKQSDPVRYKQTFGETSSPYFCARGGLGPDGGTL